MFKTSFSDFRHSDLYVVIRGTYQLLSITARTTYKALSFVVKAIAWIALRGFYYLTK